MLIARSPDCACAIPESCSRMSQATSGLLSPSVSRGAGENCRCEVLMEKGDHLVPAVDGLLRTIREPPCVEEGMACAVVAVELVTLAEFLQRCFRAVDLIAVG